MNVTSFLDLGCGISEKRTFKFQVEILTQWQLQIGLCLLGGHYSSCYHSHTHQVTLAQPCSIPRTTGSNEMDNECSQEVPVQPTANQREPLPPCSVELVAVYHMTQANELCGLSEIHLKSEVRLMCISESIVVCGEQQYCCSCRRLRSTLHETVLMLYNTP